MIGAQSYLKKQHNFRELIKKDTQSSSIKWQGIHSFLQFKFSTDAIFNKPKHIFLFSLMVKIEFS